MKLFRRLWALCAIGAVVYAAAAWPLLGASFETLAHSAGGLAAAGLAWNNRLTGVYVSERGLKVVYSIVRRTYDWTDIESVSVGRSYQFGLPAPLRRYDVLADDHPVLHMVDGREIDIRLSTFLNMLLDEEGLEDIVDEIEGHLGVVGTER